MPFVTSDFSVSGLMVRTKIESIFLISGTDLEVKSIWGPNRKMAQNVGTKNVFTPNNFLQGTT